MDFVVTLCLGGGDGGDVCVSVDVSDEERELLKDCCRESEEIDGFAGLEDLCKRIEEAARDENESCMADIDSDEGIDYDSVYYMIEMPDEIIDEVNSEEYGGEEDEEEDSVEWEDYCGYPFAMEAVNGEIISLTAEMQEKIKDRILEKLQISEEELVSYLTDLSADEEADNEKMSLIEDCDYDFLAEILGFDEDEADFLPEGIGFLDSSYGWETRDLLETLGFPLNENMNYGPHGHGTSGVVFIDDEDAAK